MMHWAPLHMEFFHFSVATLPPSRGRVWRVAAALCFTFLYLPSLVLSSPAYIGVLAICHKGDTLCSSGQGTTLGLPFPEKAASVKRLYAVLGKVNLPCWCFIVVRHGGNVHRSVCCLLLLRRVAADINPLFHKHVFQGLADWNPVYIQSETSLPWNSQILYGTIATMFSQVPRRDSQDLDCFSVVVVSSRW